MRIACVGGGPAGLYFSLLTKLRDPAAEIIVYERNPIGHIEGWGVTFGEDLLQNLYRSDPESAALIEKLACRWRGQVVDVEGKQMQHPGSSYSIKRQNLLNILADRARDLGVFIEHCREITNPSQLGGADLIVASDGVNSLTRRQSGFHTDLHLAHNRYVWLGTDKVFTSFTYAFVSTREGWVWAYIYPINSESSTFIAECSPRTWKSLGFDSMASQDALHVLERLFARHLDGHKLLAKTSDGANIQWLRFRTVNNERWHLGKTVLAGDAAHTAHFTIGWGTKLAIEDAISLADNLQRHSAFKRALDFYERERKAALRKPQSDALLSAKWFENVSRYIGLEAHQFAALLHNRRSPLIPYLPPRLYYQVQQTTEKVAVLRNLRSWAAPKAKLAYSRGKSVRSDSDPASPLSVRYGRGRCE